MTEFLAALEAVTPKGDRTDGFEAWLTWARGYARRFDPLRPPDRVAKEMAPTDEDDEGEATY